MLRSVRSLLSWYLAVEFGLLFAAIAMGGQIRGLLCLIIVIVGAVTSWTVIFWLTVPLSLPHASLAFQVLVRT